MRGERKRRGEERRGEERRGGEEGGESTCLVVIVREATSRVWQ